MVITYQDIARLDDRSQNLIMTFEQSMERTFQIWEKVYPQRDVSADPVVNARVEAQLDDLAKKFCADMGHIFNFLGSIGYQLNDHYSDVRYACGHFGV